MSRRQAREQEVIALMIRLYCKGKKHERGAASVCPACQELTEYAAERLRRCPVVESRRFCQFCTVHCYRDAMRAQITEVMRYSGPKMLWHKPLYALRHLRELHKHRRQNAAG
ncbi:MAG: nitrous oxide-stimulated promoter family protein [Coriobacteriales bacterium]|nr:nitrous oxide-stimulated promoter family protein [Coriobacteriales bacterium]